MQSRWTLGAIFGLILVCLPASARPDSYDFLGTLADQFNGNTTETGQLTPLFSSDSANSFAQNNREPQAAGTASPSSILLTFLHPPPGADDQRWPWFATTLARFEAYDFYIAPVSFTGDGVGAALDTWCLGPLVPVSSCTQFETSPLVSGSLTPDLDPGILNLLGIGLAGGFALLTRRYQNSLTIDPPFSDRPRKTEFPETRNLANSQLPKTRLRIWRRFWAQCGLIKWCLPPFKKYAVFAGRARRKEYWTFAFCYLSVLFALKGVDVLLGTFDNSYGLSGYGLLSGLYMLATITPTVAVLVRRLHDTNRSGWWYLISFIPLFGIVLLLIFAAQDGQLGPNQYGPDPKTDRVSSRSIIGLLFPVNSAADHALREHDFPGLG